MDLKSGYPFWTVFNGLPQNFPPLCTDMRCDVAVVGAGITGALAANALAADGLEVVVVDRRDAGWGSTAASTALIQYEIDRELADLAKRVGEDNAVMAYRACERAIDTLEDLATAAGPVGFERKSSLYFASRWHHATRLRAEGKLRKKHGFELEILERKELYERTGVRASVALLTPTAAQLDPYRMTYALLKNLQSDGVQVFDRSAMLGWEADEDEVRLKMQRDVTIRCKHLVIAAGYEGQQYLPGRAAVNRSSYALVTEPVLDGLGILDSTLVWESARPYLYLRTTSDGRVLVGGEDDKADIAGKRDASVLRKSRRLAGKLRNLFPEMRFEESFAWAGTFAETEDGLPFFGPHPKLSQRVHFAMAYGGNGITYSTIGAAILLAHVKRLEHPLKRLFSFQRLK